MNKEIGKVKNHYEVGGKYIITVMLNNEFDQILKEGNAVCFADSEDSKFFSGFKFWPSYLEVDLLFDESSFYVGIGDIVKLTGV